MSSLIVQSSVHNGKLEPEARKSIVDALQRVEGKKVRITIVEVKKRRSLSQNAFYWGVVIPQVMTLLESFGNKVNSQEVHDFLKREVAKMEVMIEFPNGLQKIATASSSDLTTGEWEEYLDVIRAWAAQFDCIIPFPNEWFI